MMTDNLKSGLNHPSAHPQSIYQQCGPQVIKHVKSKHILDRVKEYFNLWPGVSSNIAPTCVCVASSESMRQKIACLLPYHLECRRVLYIAHDDKHGYRIRQSICGHEDEDAYVIKHRYVTNDDAYMQGHVVETVKLYQMQTHSEPRVDMNILSSNIVNKYFYKIIDPFMKDKALDRYYDLIIVDQADRVKPNVLQHIQDYFGCFDYCNILMLVSNLSSWSNRPHSISDIDVIDCNQQEDDDDENVNPAESVDELDGLSCDPSMYAHAMQSPEHEYPTVSVPMDDDQDNEKTLGDHVFEQTTFMLDDPNHLALLD